MPTTILMLENPKINDTGKFSNISDVTRFDGSLHKAIVTMGYHRQMMNEYLCRNYLAEQIVQDMSISRVKKRMGAVSHGPGMSTIQMETVPTNRVQDELLNDEGSSNYKDWLAKSTTLEDIYRHYGMDKRSDATDTSEEKEEKVEDEEYDGQIAGYNYNYKPRPNSSPSKLGHSGDGIFLSSGVGGYPHSSSGGYPHSGGGGYSHSGSGGISYGGPSFGGHSGGGSYGAGPPIIHEQVIHIPKHHHHHIKYVDKKESLTDLFEIALTALAFLSFGMFIVHVIMCISMTTNTTTTAMGMMMPSNTGNPNMNGMGMDSNGGGGDMTDMGDGMMGNGNTGIDDTNMGGNGDDMTVDAGGGNGGENGGSDTGDTDNTDNNGDGGGMDNGGGDGMNNGDGEMTGDGGNTDDMTETDDTGGGNMPEEGDAGGEMVVVGGGDEPENENFGELNFDNSINRKKIKDLFYLYGPLRSSILKGKIIRRRRDLNNFSTDGITIISDQFLSQNDDMTATGTGGGQMTFQDEAAFEEQLDPDNSRIQDDEELTVETEETAEVPVSPAFVNFDPHDTFNQMNYRSRRNIPLTSSYSNNYSLNDLARRILISIEAATFADKDDGACLRKSLCENNRYSRDLEDGNKIWIPIWSLGMSWLTSRLGIDAPPSTTMLDSLKASILGLGKANCEIIYQNCEVEKRRLELKEKMEKLKR
ncbi:hypothetical protein WA026_014320 [Henosepilachna vigintioctopunctata]|uniref:Uncharacterized protein n=1 Tax=Henosepilachna vigintioctopunctata TaxID=420089 RepID=A0AAW1UD91_9CUCU